MRRPWRWPRRMPPPGLPASRPRQNDRSPSQTSRRIKPSESL
ncbi:hypothetical protein GLA29479_1607 [Lysobacter antibioticus]|nr:hypothetical protein GLA29479_1607 [Lysobacter antibioticus]